jgi:hypothetical protein
MKKTYIIILKDVPNTNESKAIAEVISGYFIMKAIDSNTFIVIAENKTPKEIHDLIYSKINQSISLIVVEMKLFYGRFNEKIIDWLKELFPKNDWIQ